MCVSMCVCMCVFVCACIYACACVYAVYKPWLDLGIECLVVRVA